MNLCRPLWAALVILVSSGNQSVTAGEQKEILPLKQQTTKCTRNVALTNSQQKDLNKKSATVTARVDGPRDMGLFNVEPQPRNYDVQSFIKGDSDELIGFDARFERRYSGLAK